MTGDFWECFPTNFLPFNGLFYTKASDSFNATSVSDDAPKGSYMVNAIYMYLSVQNPQRFSAGDDYRPISFLTVYQEFQKILIYK